MDLYNIFNEPIQDEPITEICKHCNGALTRVRTGMYFCVACHTIEKKMDSDFYVPELQSTSSVQGYSKEDYFELLLNSITITKVPPKAPEVLAAIRKYLESKNHMKITKQSMREILKSLNFKKEYKNIVYYMSVIIGKPLPTIGSEMREKIKGYFNEADIVWMNINGDTRKSFLCYPFFFYKLFELMGLDEYLPYMEICSSSENQEKNREYWKQMCSLLNWQYIP